MDISNGLLSVRRKIAGLSLAMLISSLFAVSAANAATFSDVQPSDWFYTYVEQLAAAGIVDSSVSKYRPADNATRAEAAKLLVVAFNMPLENPAQATFSDVPNDGKVFPYQYVETAYKNGFIGGYKDANGNLTGKFGPVDPVTRGQFTKMISLAAPLAENTKGGPHFPDVAANSTFYNYVETAYNWSVVDGNPNGTFEPSKNINRAAISKMVSNGMTPVLRQGAGFGVDSVTATSSVMAKVCFNGDVGTGADVMANYSVKDATDAALAVSKAELDTDPMCVNLTMATQVSGKEYTVTVMNVKSAADESLDVDNGTFMGFTGSSVVSAALATDNPASSTLVAGQATAELARFTFTNVGSDAVMTNLQLQRIGVSNDTTLSNVFLYDGVNRMTDSASVSSSKVNFNDASGLFTVPANGSKTVTIRADIAASTSGQTVGVALTGFTKKGDAAATTVSLSANLHTIATATLATVDFNTSTTPAATTVTPQVDYVMWQNVVSIGTREVWLKSFKVRQIGSVNNSDLANFRLYVDGTQVGTAVAAMDGQSYVNFDLSAAPVKLLTGSRTIKLVGDIINGSNRNFSFSLRQAGDAMVSDSQFNVNILATANSTTFSARSSGTQTIDTGTLTFTKKTNSPAGNTVNGAPGATLATYDVKAFGEQMKVESLSVAVLFDDDQASGFDYDDADGAAFTLRNGALYVDGVQVGSTTAIASTTDTTQGYTTFTFGSSFVVTPGTPRVFEIRADIFDNDGTNGLDGTTDTLKARIMLGSSNVQRMTSLGYAGSPASATDGNNLTVAVGALTVGKDQAYANRTIVPPKTPYLLGKFNIQNSTTEAVTITGVTVNPEAVATDVYDASDDLTNMYIKVGAYTSPIKSTVDDASNVFSTNLNIASSATMVAEVWADVASSATNGDGTADTAGMSIDVAWTTVQSASSSTSGAKTGQTITFGTGTFTPSLDGASALNRIVAGNQEVEAAKYKFTATNETYTIKEVQVKVTSAAIASVVNSVQLYDGATPVGPSATFVQASNTAALVTGLAVVVPENGSKTLTAKLMLNTIGTGAGTSQSNAALSLDSTKYSDSNGVETTDATDANGNQLYVYKSIPTVSSVDLTNTTTLVNGQAQDLYKFTVAASPQGNATLKQFILTTTWSDGGTADTLEVESWKLFEDGVDITDKVTIQDEDGNTVESTSGMLEGDEDLTVSWDTTKESVIAAGTSKTYTLRGTPQAFRVTGADTQGDTVSFYLATDATHNSTKVYLNGTATATTLWGLHTAAAATGSGTLYEFIWSDNSAAPHAEAENASSSSDWANGYKILNLDLGGESWSK